MKLTKKTVKHEVETTANVCEIAQDEFDALCAKTAASVVTEFIGNEPDVDDITAGLQLTAIFAKFVSRLDDTLFNLKNTNENPDKKEEK